MALTYLTTTISNPKSPRKTFERRFLVDSGAVYSVAPAGVLKKLGIKPESTLKFILANGEEIEKDVGQASFAINGENWTAPVIFGDPEVFLLGATTLENMGLILDPIHRKLKPLPMVI